MFLTVTLSISMYRTRCNYPDYERIREIILKALAKYCYVIQLFSDLMKNDNKFQMIQKWNGRTE